jgi:hypothetical protein
MSNKNLANNLKQLLDKEVTNNSGLFPVQSGSRINIGSYSIKPLKTGGWSVMSYKTSDIIAKTYTKVAALAIAKNLSKKKDIRRKVMELDKVIQKHHIDCQFYEYTMKVTSSSVRYESTANRHAVSKAIEENARNQLKMFIL